MSKKLKLILEFLILGLGIGITEDLIAILLATSATFSLGLLAIIFAVALPFSILGELVVDKLDIPHLGRRTELFLEFFVFGFLMGIVEDIIAIKLTSGEQITWHIVGIVTVVTLPFAIFSELIVDRVDKK